MRLLGWAAIVGVLTLSGVARAQTASDQFGIERFRLSTDPRAVLNVDSANVGDHLEYGAGVAIDFAHDPLVVYDTTMHAVDPLVQRRLSTDLVGTLSLWNRVDVGIGATIVGYQSGTAGLMVNSLPKGGLGDFRLVPKVLLAARGHMAYAFVPTLTIPGGSASGWLREAGATFAPSFAITAGGDHLGVNANLGYCLRPRTKVAGLVSDDEAFARLAVGYTVTRTTYTFLAASLAMPIVDASKNQIAPELFVGVHQRVSPIGPLDNPGPHVNVVQVFAAGGVGLDNGYGTPDWRVVAGVTFVRENVPPPPKVYPAGGESHEVHHETPVVEPPKKAKLTGTVTSATGQPIANAGVMIGSLQLVTDDNGHFETELDAGTLDVAASADGYEPGTASVTIAPGAAGDVVVKLQRKVRQGQLRGQVLSFGGQPVLGATITVGDKSVTSDADGNYSIDLPAGSVDVTIEASGFATQKRKVSIKLDGVTVLNADLRGAKK